MIVGRNCCTSKRSWVGQIGRAALPLLFSIGIVTTAPLVCRAQYTNFTLLVPFTGNDEKGSYPAGGVIEGMDGVLYGAVNSDGLNGAGIVYKVNKNGTGFTVLHAFPDGLNDGAFPMSGPIQSTNGLLYGTTSAGGAAGVGTIYRLDSNGANYTNLHHFGVSPDVGDGPIASLLEASDGKLYGTTANGNRGGNPASFGVFRINLDGSGYSFLTNIVNDCWGALIEGRDGTLYNSSYGDIFAVQKDGTGYVRFHLFDNTATNGSACFSGLIQGTDGALYGTTSLGGFADEGAVFTINTNGTGFTLLRSFTGGADGGFPDAGLIQDSTGLLYGTTSSGYGSVFRINTNGSGFSSVYQFDLLVDKSISPQALLTKASDGALYSTTYSGEGNTCPKGSVFRLSTNAINNCAYSISPTNMGFAAAGGSVNVSVTTSNGCDWNAASNDGFISVTSGSSGSGNGVVHCLIAANPDFIARTGTVTIAGLTFTATQAAAVPVPHDLAVIKLKAPKKIALSTKTTSKIGKFGVTIQNLGPQTETIPDPVTLGELVSVEIETLGTNCSSFAATLTPPKASFPLTLAPKKKLNLAYTATFDCANDPLASSKTALHNDYRTIVTIDLSAIGEADSTTTNDTCPRPPSGSDPGCGNKTSTGALGGDVLIDVSVKP